MDSRARVAFVLPSFAGGGAERVMLLLMQHMDRTRFEPSLIVLDAAGPLRAMLPPDIPLTDLKQPRLRAAMRPLGDALVASAPSVAISTMGYLNLGLLMQRRCLPASTRIVVREANEPASTLAALKPRWLFRALFRRYYRQADLILAPSSTIAANLCSDYRLTEDRIALLRNPVDTDRIRDSAAPPQRMPGRGPRFVAAGRLHRQKGFDRLLEMCSALPSDARLDVLGQGEDEASLRQTVDDLKLADRVTFHGFLDAPWPFFAGADAFLLPSRWEGMPNAALEALACGTPVIATPEAGGIIDIAELSAPGDVTLAEAGTPFIEAMSKVHPAPSEGVRPSRLPDAFSLSVVADRFQELVSTTLNSDARV